VGRKVKCSPSEQADDDYNGHSAYGIEFPENSCRDSEETEERGNSVENQVWKRLWIYFKTHHGMNE
jgi:hypothetical protein